MSDAVLPVTLPTVAASTAVAPTEPAPAVAAGAVAAGAAAPAAPFLQASVADATVRTPVRRTAAATVPAPAVFTQGSIFRHVVVMTLTSGAGLTAILLVDLMSMFYVSLAHHDAWRAAVALMSKVLFFPFAVNLGMIVGIGTVVSLALGRGDREFARRSATAGLVLIGLLGLVLSSVAVPLRFEILRLFGAEGEALDVAARLLALTLPVNVLLSVGMGCASILRACGDPTRALLVTVAGAVATSIADPIFIFGLGQGVDGVGSAVVVSRIALVAVGLWATVGVHRMVAVPGVGCNLWEIKPIVAVAIPAIAANLALPSADWYVTRTIWQFGVAASAAAGIYDRIMPFAFGLVLALAGAIVPIVGQNAGAGAFRRVRLVFFHSLTITAGFGFFVWSLLWLGAPYIAHAFGLAGGTGMFFTFLCRYATVTWVLFGFMLVANAIFMTLGRPYWATLFNWGRATLGTMPFVWLGGRTGGAETAVMGVAAGTAIFAYATVATAYRLTRDLGFGSSAHVLAASQPEAL
jgi:Na+-driven multidrug efflux pump